MTEPKTWADGVNDAIEIIKWRRGHWEASRAYPVVLATLDEVLAFLVAMKERGTFGSPLTLMNLRNDDV
jgi:hypothetical protein